MQNSTSKKEKSQSKFGLLTKILGIVMIPFIIMAALMS